MSISSVSIGQFRARKILGSFLKKDRIPKTLIFSGPPGSGKSFFAYHFAEDAACPEKIDGYACGKCTSCNFIKYHTSPDLIIITSDNQLSIKIEDMRKMQDFSAFKAVYGLTKYAVIEDAHLLTIEAFNSILKILEEPNASSNFILTTSKIDFIPQTIRSRATVVTFDSYSDDEVLELLTQMNIPSEKSELLSRICGGNVKMAINLIQNDDFEQRTDYIQDFFKLMNGGTYVPIVYKREHALTLISYWQSVLKDIYRTRILKNEKSIRNLDFSQDIISAASVFEVTDYLSIEEALLNAEEDLTQTNVNVKGYLTSMFFKFKDISIENSPLTDKY